MITLDTDILIDLARNVWEAVRCMEQIERRSVPAISVVTQMELIAMCANKRELLTLNRLLGRFLIIPVDEDISEKAVHLLSRYRISHGLHTTDAMIAATAIISGSRFITKHQKDGCRDYRFINNLELLPYPNPFG